MPFFRGLLTTAMAASFSRVLPRAAACYCLIAVALVYFFAAMLLAHGPIWLLPRSLTHDLMRDRFAALVFFLSLPTAVSLLWWGSDLFAWWRAPLELTLDQRALHIGKKSIPYIEISAIRHRHNRNHLLLKLSDGTSIRLRLNIWAHGDALADELTACVDAHLSDSIQRKLAAGETVSFGPLDLNANGLAHKGVFIPWHAIDSVRTQSEQDGMDRDETLIIATQGRMHKVDRSKIVNESVMLNCLRQYVSAA